VVVGLVVEPWRTLRSSLEAMVDRLGVGAVRRWRNLGPWTARGLAMGLAMGPVAGIIVGRLWPRRWPLLPQRGLWPPPM